MLLTSSTCSSASLRVWRKWACGSPRSTRSERMRSRERASKRRNAPVTRGWTSTSPASTIRATVTIFQTIPYYVGADGRLSTPLALTIFARLHLQQARHGALERGRPLPFRVEPVRGNGGGTDELDVLVIERVDQKDEPARGVTHVRV